MVFERVLSCVQGGSKRFPAASATLLVAGIALGLILPEAAHAQTATHYGSQTLVVRDSTNDLDSFEGIAVDGAGNLYVAACGETGVATFYLSVCKETLQSDGTYVESILFDNARNGLKGPYYVAVDTSGNVYISDEQNQRVLKETLSGGTYTQSVVTDYHGGLIFPAGIAVDSSGNVYVTDPDNKAVYKETLSGGTYTQTTIGSGLRNPVSIAVDPSGNVFIADDYVPAVYKETLSGGTYTQSVLLDSDLLNFFDTGGVATDSKGNVYVVNASGGGGGTDANAIIKATPEGDTYVFSFIANVEDPWAAAVDSSGNVFVTGFFNEVTKLSFPPTNFGSVAVGGTSPVFSFPFTIGTNTELNLLGAALSLGASSEFTDVGTGTCDTNGTSHVYEAGATCTIDVTFSPKFAGLRSGAVDLVNPSNSVIATEFISGTGTGPQAAFSTGQQSVVASGFTSPAGVAVDGNGVVYITDSGNTTNLFVETPSGTTYTQTTVNINGASPGPPVAQGIAVDGSGNIYYADSHDDYVTSVPYFEGHRNAAALLCYPQLGCGLSGPTGLAVDSNGNVYVADTGNNRVVDEVYSSGNTYNTPPKYELQAVVASGLNAPQGVATDGSGNVYIADTGNNRIVKETATGNGNFTQSVLFDTGLSAPAGIAVDDFGDIFISDTGNKRVLQELFTGTTYTQSVVALTGIGTPQGIAVDAAGDLYIADSTKGDVIELKTGTAPTLTFASTAQGATSSDSPQTVTLENLGNTALTFAVPATGDNPSISANFILGSTGATACPLLMSSSSTATLAPNATCTLPISFTPVATGTIAGSLVLTDNNLNVVKSTQTITLNGTATAGAEPAVTLDPTSLTFPVETAGTTSAAKTVKLTNSGTADLTLTSITLTGTNTADFTLDTTACVSPLAAGTSCNLLVAFKPATSGSFSASISFTDNAANSPQSVPLTGTSAAVTETGNLWFNPAPVAIAAASAQTLTATFTLKGFTTAITPTATMHYGLAYKVGAVTCTGAAGDETCTIPVTFIPNLPGGRKDALFLMNGTTRLATELAYGVGQSPLALVQPGVLTNPIKNNNGYLYGSTVDENGTLYLLETGSNAILSVTSAGVVTTLPVTGLNSPRGVGIDGAGILYIADQKPNNSITTYDTVLGVQGGVPYPSGAFYVQSVTTGNEGNVYATDSASIYTIKPDGTTTSVTISPSNTQASQLTVDSNEDLFIGGYSINEITAGGTQTQVNTAGAGDGLGVDAATTLYACRYSAFSSDSVGELPAGNYTTPQAELDSAANPLGCSVAPDGTVYVGNYTTLDKVDRSHGAPIVFGAQTNGTPSQPQTFQIYNGGNETLTLATFAVTGEGFAIPAGTANACVAGLAIAPGALCNAPIVFTGTHSGNFTGSINYTSNTLDTTATAGTVALSAYVNGINVTVSPATLNFGDVTDGTTSSSKTVTFTNNGVNANASISTPPSVAGFTISQGTCTTSFAPGSSCSFTVTFSPTAPQTYSGTASVTAGSDASTQTQSLSFAVAGTGTAAAAPAASLSPTTLSFPNTTLGSTSTAMSTTLSNTGNATLNISGITLSDTTDFVETTTCGTTLTAGKTCSISVTFKPSAAQSYTATLTVADDATGSPQTVALSGTGVGGVLASPTSVNFGNVTEYTQTNARQYITLTNTTGSDVTLGSYTSSNPAFFAEDDTCTGGTDLPANSTCQIYAEFLPQAVGLISGTLTIPYTGAGGGNLSVGLAGTGTAGTPAIDLYPLPVAFGTSPVLTSAKPISLQVENIGTAPLTGITASITGANATDYTQTNTCSGVTVDPSGFGTGACNITVTFTPTAAGRRNASLTVTSNSGAATLSTPLTGAGVANLPQIQFTPTQLNLFAGAGSPCAGATGGAATAATLCNVTNAAQDYLGNTYLVDKTYNVVYKVDTTGTLSIFAGTPSKTGGYTGDGALATAATLSGPTAVAADAFGNVYISDTANSAIRVVDITGTINSFVDSQCEGGVRGTPHRFNATTKPGKLHAHDVELCETFQPEGMVVDSFGNLIFADTLNNVVLEVDVTKGNLTFVAGDAESLTGTAGYNGDNVPADGAELNAPQDVAVDGAGNVYIADTLNNRIRKVTTATGIITTIAGNGTAGNTGDGAAATSAEITPYGVAADLAGDVFVAGGTGGLVRKVDTGGTITTFAGGGTGAISGPASTGAIANAYFPRADNAGDLLIPAGLQVLAAGPDGLLQFASEPIGTTSTALTATIENTGDTNLSIESTGTSITGADAGDFALAGGNCGTSLAPGKICTIDVTFTPSASGTRTASVSVGSNAAGSPATILLQGSGTAATAPAASLSPTSIAFPNTTAGTTATAISTTLSNTGTGALTITGITLTGTNPTDFAETNTCGTSLAAGATCTISVTFTPAAVASYTASISVADNAPGSPQTATLSGTGTAVPVPIASLSPTTLAFPATTAGQTSAALSTTLSNTGNAVLNITGITLTGANPTDFATTTTCGATLAAGATCTIAATFTPTAAGSFSATISVADNAAGSPQTATLTGTGNPPLATDFALTVTPPTKTVAPGGVAQYTVNTTGIGGDFDSAIQLTATGLPTGFTASFNPASVTPGASGASSILSIQTTSPFALAHPQQHRAPWLPASLTALLIIPLLGMRKRFRKLGALARTLSVVLLLAGSLAPVLLLTGCSGGYYSLQTQTYTVTVTGTSGSTQHSTTVTLTVQQ